ncbi:superoxide dismutase family protein [Flavobacterium terrae]|uniref:Superoxide dismutase [Cu-Zn] n=1 Tax=Flavobacterium terrae TaxID=415425 RepID=A0A1M6H102_9FLAO|nr:superoxide dismutase family protein [Flavobacterium terrae]SHJ15804.1 superoxide dismutase, Cu-Zn family [Flavobacterium terrae]
MKKIVIFTILAGATIFACKTASGTKNEIKLTLESKSDTKTTGTATFTEKNGVVTFTANIQGLTPGEHAIHIHEKADCSAADASSAGGHWNPTFKKHGKWGAAEYHKGDIGNFTADANGNGKITFSTNEWCIGCGDATKDITGKGLIVHKGSDDFTTQPTGNAGGRVACAGIIK